MFISGLIVDQDYQESRLWWINWHFKTSKRHKQMNENKNYVLRWNVGDTENTYIDVTNSSGLGITATMAMLLVFKVGYLFREPI